MTLLDVRSPDGTRLTVRREGTGDPIVLLHGSGGGLHSWDPLVAQLAGSYELWIPARRGYAPSDAPPTRKSFKDEVADVTAVLTAVGRPTHLVGASYGAILALHTAAALAQHAPTPAAPHPAAVSDAARAAVSAAPPALRSLTVFEPPMFASGPGIAPLLDRYRDCFERDDHAGMFAVLNEVTQVPRRIAAAFGPPSRNPAAEIGWLHDLEALADNDPHFTADLTVPTLILQGADTWDPMPAGIDALAAALPHARRISWPGQSHFAPSLAPELMATALSDFFADQRK
ncbi:alpha/beta fold hydrolase [Paractinoplanes atraurantiacus]|uniref:Pimeloyl-ACP methyl ester carboxylesterase n=1 Tax=Paractinoplanes atraurantiacus TaxID=1036182 RepID=A0A285IGS3_9ACTN|nr:alpha/beta hydrolase [Actinoplanes atraurantiacus]SNY47152.1 Pimeloyl-ACP methyl ester carboxylesterase [Actinoplanes atraurantiacus]